MKAQVKHSKIPMTLGIISLFIWSSPMIGIPVSTVGIAISSKWLKKDKCKAYKIGLSLNIIGLILTILFFVIVYCLLMQK